MSHILKLTGSMKGETVVLNGHKFVDGQLEIQLPKDAGLVSYFEKCYQTELVEGKVKANDKVSDNGQGGKTTEGEVNEKLVEAIQKLDPAVDEHWTKDGLPAIEAVQKFYGSADVKRADIKAAAPDFTRETAKAAE